MERGRAGSEGGKGIVLEGVFFIKKLLMAILFLEASRIVVPVRCFVQFSLLNEPTPIKMCLCYF